VAAGDDRPPKAPEVVIGDDMPPGAIWMFGPRDAPAGVLTPVNAFAPEIGITGGGVDAPVPAGISVAPAVGTDTLELPDGVLPDHVLGPPDGGPAVAASAWRTSAAWLVD